jgi:hypothetical protein
MIVANKEIDDNKKEANRLGLYTNQIPVIWLVLASYQHWSVGISVSGWY